MLFLIATTPVPSQEATESDTNAHLSPLSMSPSVMYLHVPLGIAS